MNRFMKFLKAYSVIIVGYSAVVSLIGIMYSIFVLLNITEETFGIFLLLPLATANAISNVINFILYGTMVKALVSNYEIKLKRIMMIIWIVFAILSGISAVYDDGSSITALIIAEAIIYLPPILYLHWYIKNYDYYAR